MYYRKHFGISLVTKFDYRDYIVKKVGKVIERDVDLTSFDRYHARDDSMRLNSKLHSCRLTR